MRDILYEAAVEYKKLEKIIYEIIVGRKGKSYTLMLHFSPDSFFHLAGLQHLTDIIFPSTNKERIYKEILAKNITIDTIKGSVFYSENHIEERITNLYLLREIIESNSATYLINKNKYAQFTTIKADFLCEYMKQDIFYLFISVEKKSPKFENECRGCSFFKKYSTDYTRGAAKTTTLLIKKKYTDKKDEKIVYQNPSYK